jgi:3-oxoacyl-[acyl-carrier-protein] synthase-1
VNRRLQISAQSLVSALGNGAEAHYQALKDGESGLRVCDLEGVNLDTWIGRVAGIEDVVIKDTLAEYDCRNNRLGQLALEQDGFTEAVNRATTRYGCHRIGVFLGTSTSGVQQTEKAYADRDEDSGDLPSYFNYRTTHNMFSIADFTQHYLGLEGPAMVVSTACSSSAKVFANAQRYLRAGICDAAIVGGVDTLCHMTLYGFNALQLVSSQPCCPADQDRDGINIGEAAGFALLEWEQDEGSICLLGYGESSDAYHMSSPHPEGMGAAMAMRQSLRSAGLQPSDIDYINLHGTATPANDLSEDRALMDVFAGEVPCSSTKGFTGHTLGAAGIVEAIFSCIAIERNLIPRSLNTRSVDEAIHSPIVLRTREQPVSRVMSNSFGFGGSNASLILGYAP